MQKNKGGETKVEKKKKEKLRKRKKGKLNIDREEKRRS